MQDNKRQYVSGYKQQKMHLSVFPFWLLIKALILRLDLQGQNTHAEQLSLSQFDGWQGKSSVTQSLL